MRTTAEAKILKAARELFWKFGIKKTSVEEVCSAAGVSKMTFYRKFANKTELAIAILRQLQEEGIQQYKSIMAQQVSFTEKMAELVLLKRSGMQGMSDAFLHDAYGHPDDDLRAALTDISQSGAELFINDIKKAQELGEIRQDLDPGFIIEIRDLLMTKLSDDEFMSRYPSQTDAVMELVNFFMYGIMQKHNTRA